MLTNAIIGIVISSLVAGVAYFKKSLNISGMIAAVFFGTIIYIFGQFLVWSALISFFVSSSILTKIHTKKDSDGVNVQKHGRNYIQVISNALISTIFIILYYYLNHEIWLVASIVSIASSNSDTWASEIGILSKRTTFSILTLKPVEKGSSGGVSHLGMVASILGALFIAVIFTSVYGFRYGFQLPVMLTQGAIITIGGFLGSIIDSYLGVIFQAKYQGIKSGSIYEVSNVKNESTILLSGYRIINNDMVNLLSGLFAALIIVLIFK